MSGFKMSSQVHTPPWGSHVKYIEWKKVLATIVVLLCPVFYYIIISVPKGYIGRPKPIREVSLVCHEFERQTSETGFATSGCNGRLGNQLGFLSLGLEYHLKFGVKIIIGEGQAKELSHAFAMEKICYMKSPFCVIKPKQCDYPKIPKVPFPQTSGNLTGRRIDLPIYPQFIKNLVTGYLHEFRQVMSFRQDVLDIAFQLLKEVKADIGCTEEMAKCTIVTIHLRMGDYDNHLKALGWGPNVLTETNYVTQAFKHVIEKYENPKFLLLGESKEDLLQYMDNKEMEFAKNITTVPAITRDSLSSDTFLYKGIDLLLLSMGDVSIITYGSYGIFGGLLTKDKAIFHPKKHPALEETQLNEGNIPLYHPLPWSKIQDVSPEYS